MKRILMILIIITSLAAVHGQKTTGIAVKDEKVLPQSPPEMHNIFDFGAGIGLDYGGVMGIKFTVSPIKYLGLFVSGGIQVAGFGWQFGALGYILSKTTKNMARPYVKVMYGTNGGIYVEGADEYNKLYTGVTPGVGCELRFGAKRKHGLNADFNIIIRSQEFKDDLEKVQNDPRIYDYTEPLPVAFSVGYHFEF